MWNGSQVQRRSNKSTRKCKEMILGAADLRLKTTGTILQKSSLLRGGKSSNIMSFGNTVQGLELVLVASQDTVWYKGKAGEVDATEEPHGLSFWREPHGLSFGILVRQAEEKRLDFVVTTTAINLGWLREEKAKGTCSHTHPYFTQRSTPKAQNVALTTLHPQHKCH